MKIKRTNKNGYENQFILDDKLVEYICDCENSTLLKKYKDKIIYEIWLKDKVDTKKLKVGSQISVIRADMFWNCEIVKVDIKNNYLIVKEH